MVRVNKKGSVTMIRAIYTRTFNVLKGIPVKLWGLSLLNALLVTLIPLLGVNIPLVSIPLYAALNAGMIAIYYKTYSTGDTPDVKQMFTAFASFKDFKHIAGGMCWMYLWLFLWALIPIAGPVIAVYKSIQYSFTPYILLEEKSVRAFDALKKSKDDTKGCKAKIFLGVMLPVAAYIVAVMIFLALAAIPAAGAVFLIIALILTLIFSLVAPLFLGLAEAGFYEYCKKPAKVTPDESSEPKTYVKCPSCGTDNSSDKKFCIKCGSKM